MRKIKKFKKVILFLGAILLSFMVAGCSKSNDSKSSSPKSEKVWRVAAGDMLQSMDSSKFFDQNSMQVVNNVMEGLYRYRGTQIEPALATTIAKPDSTGLRYQIKLRSNAKWSNGDPITADDFVFAWRRTVDPKTKAQYGYLYSGIKNADAIMKGKLSPESLGIKKEDDHTFTVELEHPIPYFSALMTNTPFFPQNEKTVKKYSDTYGTTSDKTVYNGPFTLSKWNGTSNSWTLLRNLHYWNQAQVHLDRIEYQVVKDPNTALDLFENKQLDDIVLNGPLAKQKRKDLNFKTRQLTRTMYLTLNQGKNPAFKNEKIRKAISLTIDRKQLTTNILEDGSFPIYVLVPFGLANDPASKQDFSKQVNKEYENQHALYVSKAMRLWNEGKKEVGIKDVNWTILGEDNDINKKLMEYFQDRLEKLPGLKINIQSVPHKTRLQQGQNGEFDLMTSQVAADFPDPVAIMNVQTTDNVYNFGRTSNHVYDELIAQSNTQEDAKERFKTMEKALDLLSANQEVVPIYQLVEAHLTRPALKNVTNTPNNLFNYIGATLSEK